MPFTTAILEVSFTPATRRDARQYRHGDAGEQAIARIGVAAFGVGERRAVGLPLGVQVLVGANSAALAVAHACSATFVRVKGLRVRARGAQGCTGPVQLLEVGAWRTSNVQRRCEC
jgi:predicted TIM-barrel enzyme